MPPELKDMMKKMLSNLGNTLLFLNVILSLSIIYLLKNLKISEVLDKNIYQLVYFKAPQ